MSYTPKEIAELLKDKPQQAHYIESLIQKAIEHAIDKTAFGRIGSLEGALEQQKARMERLKPALDLLGKKLGRFTADPLDLRLILEEATSEIDRLRTNWQEDRKLLIEIMERHDEL